MAKCDYVCGIGPQTKAKWTELEQKKVGTALYQYHSNSKSGSPI